VKSDLELKFRGACSTRWRNSHRRVHRHFCSTLQGLQLGRRRSAWRVRLTDSHLTQCQLDH